MKGECDMKKDYLAPELEKIVFSVEDIIATSAVITPEDPTPEVGGGGLPIDPVNLMS